MGVAVSANALLVSRPGGQPLASSIVTSPGLPTPISPMHYVLSVAYRRLLPDGLVYLQPDWIMAVRAKDLLDEDGCHDHA